MIALAPVTVGKVLVGILFVSLAVLVLIIAYRKLLGYLGKGAVSKEDYCVLYGLEEDPVAGEISFYFTSETKRAVRIHILDDQYGFVNEVFGAECKIGGNIIRFQTSILPNGRYFYCLMTDNQKTMKKMTVANP